MSNTATGFAHPLYDSHGQPRCTGKERGAEAELDFFRARYLSSAASPLPSVFFLAHHRPAPLE
jgi:hypothetical protein